MDTNSQYAGAVNLVCCPRCRGLLRTTPASPERRQGFAPDWPPEGSEFEPSVPRDTTKVSRGCYFGAACLPANGKAARSSADTTRTPGIRGTDGSNSTSSSGESGANSVRTPVAAILVSATAADLNVRAFAADLSEQASDGFRGGPSVRQSGPTASTSSPGPSPVPSSRPIILTI